MWKGPKRGICWRPRLVRWGAPQGLGVWAESWVVLLGWNFLLASPCISGFPAMRVLDPTGTPSDFLLWL